MVFIISYSFDAISEESSFFSFYVFLLLSFYLLSTLSIGFGGKICFTTKFELEALQADVVLSNLSNGLSMGGREQVKCLVTIKFELETVNGRCRPV